MFYILFHTTRNDKLQSSCHSWQFILYVEIAFRSNENKKEVQSELSQKRKWNRAIPVVLRQLMCGKEVKEVLTAGVNQKNGTK